MTSSTTGPVRFEPALPCASYKTYSIASPLATHTRPATCADVECDAYTRGWATTIDLAAPVIHPRTGQRTGFTGGDQADYIRVKSGRRFTEEYLSGTVVRFTFLPGQQGFSPHHDHRVSLERPELFIVRGGDWRGNPTGERFVHTKPSHWVEDFAEHQDTLATALGKG